MHNAGSQLSVSQHKSPYNTNTISVMLIVLTWIPIQTSYTQLTSSILELTDEGGRQEDAAEEGGASSLLVYLTSVPHANADAVSAAQEPAQQ